MKRTISTVLAFGAFLATPAVAQSWKDSVPVKQLYEAAKNDGQVVVWGTAAIEVDWIPAAFKAMFPGIEVRVLGDNDVATKAIAEYRAGRYEIDVFMTSYSAGRALLDRNMYGRIEWSTFG